MDGQTYLISNSLYGCLNGTLDQSYNNTNVFNVICRAQKARNVSYFDAAAYVS